MRLIFLFLACLLWAGAASAAEVRFPETGGPAFALELPVEWVTATDNDGNMEVAPRIRNVVMVLSIGPDSSTSLDDFAAGMMKAAGADPVSRRETGAMDGHQGTIYYSAMDNPSDPSGLRVNIRLMLVRPDAGTIATCAFLINGSATAADIAASQAVMDGIKFVH